MGSRADGTNPRALGTNPRALRANMRANRKIYSKAQRMAWKTPEALKPGQLPRWLRFEVLKRCGFRCSYCGARPKDGAWLEVDHIVPRAAGGSDEPDNLTAACQACNNGKGATKLSERRI